MGIAVALLAGAGSCHFTRTRADAIAPAERDAIAVTQPRPAIATRPSATIVPARPAIAIVSTKPSPTPHPKRRVRTPHVDCTPIAEVGFHKGKRQPLTTIRIDDDLVETSTANAYWAMRDAAAEEALALTIYSGFRTNAEQAWFYRCYECGCCNGGVLAAKPGFSNHQSGHALDIDTWPDGVLPWLKANAARFGFTNTVRSEPWHWEYSGSPTFEAVCKARR